VKACGFCGVWMRFEPRQPLQIKKAPMYSVLFVLPKPPALLILCRFTASP